MDLSLSSPLKPKPLEVTSNKYYYYSSSFYQEGASRGFLSKAKKDRSNDDNVCFQIDNLRKRTVMDDDDSTRVYDGVIPPIKVMALSFSNAARARIENAGGKCLSVHQAPLGLQKQFFSDFPTHHDTMLIFNFNNNNNNITSSSSSNQTTMRNVRRRIAQGQEEYYCRIPSMTGLVMDNDDLLCKILIRLPAKTLGGLKVINKRWYSFISDPSFVSKHTTSLLQTAARGGHSTFISQSFERLCTLLSLDCPSPNLFTETTFTLSLPAESYGPPVMMPQPLFYASDRGLLLVKTGHNSYIYNPLTKKYKCIPFPYKKLSPNYGIIFGGSTSSGQYDCNHYTLVCLLQACKGFKFMIFLPKKSRWRDSNKSSGISYGIYGLKRSSLCTEILPVCNRRIIHWLTREGYIVAFDLDKEESRMIEIPRSVMAIEVDADWWDCTWFGVLEDEVILVVATPKHELVTWVLHDYENNKWKIKRKDVINPGKFSVVYIRPLFFDGQRFLLSMTTNSYYKSGYRAQLRIEHDVQTGVSKHLPSKGSSCFASTLLCVPITSTLTEV